MSQSLGNASSAGKERGYPDSLRKSARGYAAREDCSGKRGYAEEGKSGHASVGLAEKGSGVRVQQGTSVANSPPQNPSVAGTNRLTIAFLLLWMLGTSAELADDYWQLAAVQDAAPAKLFYWNTHMLVFSPLHGAALAYAILVIGRLCLRRESGVTAPGHWFLAIHGSYGLIAWTYLLLILPVPIEFFQTVPRWIYLAKDTLIYGSLMLLAAYGMFVMRANLAWRFMLLLLAVVKGEALLREWVFTFIRGSSWFSDEIIDGIFGKTLYSSPALAAIGGIVIDIRRGEKRDFLHWVGVWTLLLLVACEWPSWIWWREVFR
jgi:hypothetical protein